MAVAAIARWVTLGALFLVPFLALYVDKALYFPFVTGRGFAFRLIVEVAVAGWMVMAAAERRYRPRVSAVAVIFAVLVGWMALADVLAVNPHNALWGNYERMDGWVNLAHLFGFFLVAGSVLGAENLWTRWWLAFAAASGLVCGLGLLQVARLAPAPVWPRIDAGFGNPEFVAGYLLFAIPTTLWLAAEVSGPGMRLRRGGLLSLAALQVAVLAASGTRGAYAGLALGGALGAVLWLRQAGRPGRVAVAAGAAVAGLVLAGVLAAVRLSGDLAHNPMLARLTGFGLGEVRVRLTLWRMAWEGFLSRPLTGWGHEGFTYVFQRFYDPSLAGQEPWFDRAHDIYLDALVAGGAPALLLLLALLASAAYALARAPISPAGRLLLLSALLAYAVQGLVVFDHLMTEAPLAAVLAMAHAARARPLAALARAPELTARRLAGVAAPLALAALALVVGLGNAPGLRANRDLNRVLNPSNGGPLPLAYFKSALDDRGFAHAEIRDKLVQAATAVAGSDAPDADKAPFLAYAVAQMRTELQRAPHEARLRLDLARLYRRMGDFDHAAAESAAALRDAPGNPLLRKEADLDARQAAAAPATD